MRKICSIALILLVAGLVAAQAGGGFNLEQNVMGNGGWRSESGGFTVLGTMGQSNAGSTASGGGFHLIDGLWAIENPAAASPFAVVSGRVTGAVGFGLPRVLVTMTNQTTNLSYQTFTQAHGFYRLEGLPTGARYTVTVSHRRFEFEPAMMSLFISQDRENVDFVSPQN
jgi:hypothetical protein